MNRLGMFAKYWQPGKVKTRLAEDVGDVAAAKLYYHFVQCLLRRFAEFGDQRQLCFTPAGRREDFALLAQSNWQLSVQSDGDLGERMKAYFLSSATNDSNAISKILLIGSDTPHLPQSYLKQAVDEMELAPLVLGPSDDGGYYLVGLRSDAIDEGLLGTLFDEMPWSAPNLWAVTSERLGAAGYSFRVLPSSFDVDDWDSLKRLHIELKFSGAGAGPLSELAQVVAETMSC